MQLKHQRMREIDHQHDRQRAQELINKMDRDMSSNGRATRWVASAGRTCQQSRPGTKSVDGEEYEDSSFHERPGRYMRYPRSTYNRDAHTGHRSRPSSVNTHRAKSMNELLSKMSIDDRQSVIVALKDELKLYQDVRH